MQNEHGLFIEQKPFKLHSEYKPTGDQPRAIAELVEGFVSYCIDGFYNTISR